MSKIKVPFLIVNPKSYLYGQKSLELALAAEKAQEETGVCMMFTCPFADIRLIKENTKNIIVTAQHMDKLTPGRGMGHVLPESLKEAGAEAVFLNHAENSLKVADLYAIMNRAKELNISTVVCADSVAEGKALVKFNPDIILCEPTDLIGTGKVADDSYMVDVINTIRKENPETLIMIASGVSTPDDVYHIIKLGADGTGATSGILNAPDPKERIMEMAKAMKKAAVERGLM